MTPIRRLPDARRFPAALVTLVAVMAVGPAAHAGPARVEFPAELRQQFLDAYAQASKGKAPTDGADSADLKAYPLYPYVEAARLERRLEDPAAAPEIQAFLDRYGGQPVARPIRREWLMALALRKQWDDYLAVYRPDVNDSIAARCNAYAARIALGRTDGLADKVITEWSAPKSLPPVCDAAFDWLKSQGLLTSTLIERRARAALDAGQAGLARYLARALPATTAAPIEQWAGLIEQPRASVDALIATPSRTVESKALLDGWRRYARADVDAAVLRYPELVQARGLDASAASPFAIAVGLRLALGRDLRALDFFALGQASDFDEQAHEWHARAALWAGDWTRARQAIDAMPESLRNQNRWKYWMARVAEQLGDPVAAKAGYVAILPTDNWYAVLSAARLGKQFAPTFKPAGASDAGMDRLATEAPFVRARELALCDMQSEAIAEWRAGYDALEPAAQVQAIGLAARWTWYLQAISAAAKLGVFDDYDLLYPHPYDSEVRRGSTLSGLPPDLIYAIIRQESLYRADARSSADAIGLMQLLPATARQTAKSWGLPAPSNASLVIPSVNVPLGSAYLRSMLDRWNGQAPFAIASYNAGPGAVKRWLPAAPMATDVWVENIPYNETRTYVQRVSWHRVVFGWIDDRKPRDFSAWLGTVQRPAADALPATDEGSDDAPES
jgi:soluble lytic murein transglycosylase